MRLPIELGLFAFWQGLSHDVDVLKASFNTVPLAFCWVTAIGVNRMDLVI